MNIIIFGHKQHGKDTACEFLQEHLDINYRSSSEYACEKFLFAQMREQYGYLTINECFNDRVNHRKYWFDEIAAYNDPDPTRLGREIFEENTIYCGIRNDVEFYALKAAGLIDLAIWIDASERKPLEDADSMKLRAEHADIIIPNNSTQSFFEDRLARLFEYLNLA